MDADEDAMEEDEGWEEMTEEEVLELELRAEWAGWRRALYSWTSLD